MTAIQMDNLSASLMKAKVITCDAAHSVPLYCVNSRNNHILTIAGQWATLVLYKLPLGTGEMLTGLPLALEVHSGGVQCETSQESHPCHQCKL